MNTSPNLILAADLRSERMKRKKKQVDEMNKRVEGEKLEMTKPDAP